MQTKLTLRVEEVLVRKAKRIAKKRGTSVSRIFGQFISEQTDELPTDDFPPITASMVGAIRREGNKVEESDYRRHLERKYQ